MPLHPIAGGQGLPAWVLPPPDPHSALQGSPTRERNPKVGPLESSKNNPRPLFRQERALRSPAGRWRLLLCGVRECPLANWEAAHYVMRTGSQGSSESSAAHPMLPKSALSAQNKPCLWNPSGPFHRCWSPVLSCLAQCLGRAAPQYPRDSWTPLGVQSPDRPHLEGAGGRGVVLSWCMSQHPQEVRQGHVGQHGFSRDGY